MRETMFSPFSIMRVGRAGVTALFTLTPLFFLPVTQDFYDFNKLTFLIVGTCVIAILWAFELFASRKIRITLSPSVLGFGSLAFAYAVSVIFASPNKIEGLFASMGPVTFACLTFITALGSHWFDQPSRNRLRWMLYIAAAVVALIAVYQYFNLGATVLPMIPFLADRLWTPIGSAAGAITFLALMVPLLGESLLRSIKKREDLPTAGTGVLIVLTLFGIILTAVQIVPQIKSVFLPIPAGWKIFLEAMKQPVSAIVGVGPENFLYAFTQGRPVDLNLSTIWNQRFATNATLLLHVLTTAGVTGALALSVLVFGMYRIIKHNIISGTSLGFAWIAFLLLPPSMPIIILVAAICFILGSRTEKQILYQPSSRTSWVLAPISLGIICIAAAAWYGVGRVYLSEIIFYQSVLPEAQTNGTEVYRKQIQAIALNPFVARFHGRYSRTNLAIANALAQASSRQTENGQPSTMTEEERQTIAQLIQQSIREAKIAVTYAPKNVTAWENLAGVYQNLIGVADGADQWSVATLQQAISLDPTNPLLRTELGGLYVSRSQYPEALNQFNAAIQLKPDFANAYYNQANAHKLMGNISFAISSLDRILGLIPSGSSDYAKAENERDELIRLRDQNTEQQPSFPVSPPQTSPSQTQETQSLFLEPDQQEGTESSGINPPISLPEETGP